MSDDLSEYEGQLPVRHAGQVLLPARHQLQVIFSWSCGSGTPPCETGAKREREGEGEGEGETEGGGAGEGEGRGREGDSTGTSYKRLVQKGDRHRHPLPTKRAVPVLTRIKERVAGTDTCSLRPYLRPHSLIPAVPLNSQTVQKTVSPTPHSLIPLVPHDGGF